MQKRVIRDVSQVTNFYKSAILEVPINNIVIGKYQKELNRARVNMIVSNFNPARMRPIEVSYRDGRYWCWDGQHRLAAYNQRGMATIPCQVHFGLTYEDEARLFAEQQVNVGSITSAHKYHALREAHDETVIAIDKKCAEYGFKVNPKGIGGKNIRAVKALQGITKKSGISRLETIVWLLNAAWNHEAESTKEDIISGIALFLDKYLLKERCASDFEHNKAILERLHSKLASMTAARLLQKSTEQMAIKGGDRRVAMTIHGLYNERLRGGSKLPPMKF